MDIHDDDDKVLAGIRLNRNCTSPRRRYTSTTVYDRLDLDLIRDHVFSLLDILHVVELFLLVVGSLLDLAKRVGYNSALLKLAKLLKLFLAFIALWEFEMDILVESEIDLQTVTLDENPPLLILPKNIEESMILSQILRISLLGLLSPRFVNFFFIFVYQN